MLIGPWALEYEDLSMEYCSTCLRDLFQCLHFKSGKTHNMVFEFPNRRTRNFWRNYSRSWRTKRAKKFVGKNSSCSWKSFAPLRKHYSHQEENPSSRHWTIWAFYKLSRSRFRPRTPSRRPPPSTYYFSSSSFRPRWYASTCCSS